MKKLLLLIGYIFLTSCLQAQERTPLLDSLPKVITGQQNQSSTSLAPLQVDWTKFGIATGILAASAVGLHILQYNSWWAKDRQPFHVYDDPVYKANFDKFGHIFGAYYASHFFKEAYQWSGLDSARSDLIASLSGAIYEFYVEIEDGYGKDWGFSPGDATADILGATFFLLRNRIDFLRNFQYKWFYFPSQQILKGNADIPGQSLNPIDDYGGQSYWVTVDINRMLPESAKRYWPSWLMLAFGMGGYNIGNESTSTDINPEVKPQIAYYLSIDYDLEKVIPESSIGVINFLRRGLSYWHFPTPAYRITPDPRFFVLFPLRMTF